METDARYVLIGAFTLSVVGALVLFVFFIAFNTADRDMVDYDIYFNNSVSGLAKGSDVLFNGIKVGAVKTVTFDPSDPQKVVVRIRIDDDTPIRQGASAHLEMTGLTGSLAILIRGGGKDAPPILPAEGKSVAVIPSEISSLDKFVYNLPKLVDNSVELVKGMRDFVTDEDNKNAINGILFDVKALSGVMKNKANTIGDIIDKIDRVSANLERTTAALEKESLKADKILGQSGKTLEAIEGASLEIKSLVADMRPGLSNYSRSGLMSLYLASEDMRQTAETLDAFLRKMTYDPPSNIFSRGVQEYKPKE